MGRKERQRVRGRRRGRGRGGEGKRKRGREGDRETGREGEGVEREREETLSPDMLNQNLKFNKLCRCTS